MVLSEIPVLTFGLVGTVRRPALFRISLPFPLQPGAGESPIAVDAARAYTQGRGGLVDAQTNIEPQAHHTSRLCVLLFKAQDQVVERQGIGNIFVVGQVQHIFDIQQSSTVAAFGGPAFTGVINQYSPHGLRRGEKELSAIDNFQWSVAVQLQPCFVDQRGGLQRMGRTFIAQPPSGDREQSRVDLFKQRLWSIVLCFTHWQSVLVRV